jgi:hypothetical protein
MVLVRGRISRTDFIVLDDQTEETEGVLGTVLELGSCCKEYFFLVINILK